MEQKVVEVAKAPLIKRVVGVIEILEVSDSVSGHKFPCGQALNNEVRVKAKQSKNYHPTNNEDK